MSSNKVEIGFDLSGLPDSAFARLDDPFYGLLDAPQTILGGEIFQDVTPSLLSFGISRGKSRQLDRYNAGRLQVNLDNNQRIFDPLYEDSPYRTQLIPKRAVRLTSNDIIQYEGVIDDWDLSYEPQGNSIARIVASDAFTQLANQTLIGGTAIAQTTGERIEAVLDDAGVKWPDDKKQIETGRQELQAGTINPGTSAFSYLQQIASAEPGPLFISKTGSLVFKDRAAQSGGTPVVFSDDGSGIGYQGLSVVYGSELLFNEIEVSRQNGGTAVANDLDSQEEYGIQNLTLNDLPLDTDQSAQELATYLAAQYAQPEYRFESIELELRNLTEEQQNAVLGLELSDIVRVKFTPNNIPPAIDRYAEIIGISHSATPVSHKVTFNLASTEYYFFTLSDLVFGRLSSGNSLGY
jgi:hypothetical protein